MNRRPLVVAAMIASVVCGACTPHDWIAKLVPPDVDRYARGVIDTARLRPADAILPMLTPAAAAIPSVLDSLTALHDAMPHGPIDSIKVYGVNVLTQGGTTQRNITYEFRAGGQWALFGLIVVEDS